LPSLFLPFDECTSEIQREIHQHIYDELEEVGIQNMHLSFYLTSIYDYSIFEAFSKVIQKLIPELGAMENLLNILCAVRFWMKFILRWSLMRSIELWDGKGVPV
jgi:hypothetical protein